LLDIVLSNLSKKGSVFLSFHKEENSVKTFKVVFSPNKKPKGNRRIIRKSIFLSLLELQGQGEKIGNMFNPGIHAGVNLCQDVQDFLETSKKGIKIEAKGISIFSYWPNPALDISFSVSGRDKGELFYTEALRRYLNMYNDRNKEM